MYAITFHADDNRNPFDSDCIPVDDKLTERGIIDFLTEIDARTLEWYTITQYGDAGEVLQQWNGREWLEELTQHYNPVTGYEFYFDDEDHSNITVIHRLNRTTTITKWINTHEETLHDGFVKVSGSNKIRLDELPDTARRIATSGMSITDRV